MRTFRISHRTQYTYDKAVRFGVHRLMIRPRDAHDMRILDSSLTVAPQADIRWAFDTFGNSVALLSFHEASSELIIASELVLRRYGFDEPLVRIERDAGPYPFDYDPQDSVDLAPLRVIHCPQDQTIVTEWIKSVMPVVPTGSLQVLDLISSAIHETFTYRRREEQGVQSPARTITTASGTCRDYAYLFMEAARSLGFAARFVTGYLYDPAADTTPQEADDSNAVSGAGATHAWADVFLPGAGWIEFDPTNSIVASRDLVRVATTRMPEQAQPVIGTYSHDGAVLLDMDVQVFVTRSD
ncbi:MAG: transglutaminase family protein [Alphaproteobacteria bacterium]|nr:transglutaminase family protein [Alphaproteobacteria bacterium]MBU0795788.1 transglutaminase family protein [Alphaproteobacteria bacterium]MBU0886650.1 transglutaminase family protein [Alphaproteobacteria bacterium]MBU1814505.1 transglutaminase family protein [Alphaproteobacteria bacterium]